MFLSARSSASLSLTLSEMIEEIADAYLMYSYESYYFMCKAGLESGNPPIEMDKPEPEPESKVQVVPQEKLTWFQRTKNAVMSCGK